MSFVEEVSARKTEEVVAKVQVKLQNSASDQVKAVVGTLLEGVKATPRPAAAGTGQNLNVKA